MRKLLTASLLGLPWLVAPSPAHAWEGMYTRKLDLGHKFVFSFGCAPQAGPWYLYWPYEAHFGVSAPWFGSGCNSCGVMGPGAWLGGGGGWPGMGGAGPGMDGGTWPVGNMGGCCAGGACVPGGAMPPAPMMSNSPQNPMIARPNYPAPVATPTGFQPTGFSTSVPYYWYGR
jgi:hypothetical protein